MIHRIILTFMILLVSGCIHMPTVELGQYKNAFTQTRQAAESILLDYDKTLKESRQFITVYEGSDSTNDSKPKSPYPSDIKIFEEQSGKARDTDIQTRQKAFLVIASYNDVLTTLAEGKSVKEVKSAASGLVTAAGKLSEVALSATVPGLSALSDLAKIITGFFENVRLREEFIMAITDGAPKVEQIFNILIDDTEYHYKSRFALSNSERTLIVGEMVSQMRQLKAIIKTYKEPDDTMTSREDLEKEINDSLAIAVIDLGNKGYPYKITTWPIGGTTYTAVAKNQISQIIKIIEELVEKYERNVNHMNVLGKTLSNYRKLLRKTIVALNSLEAALSNPQDISKMADEMLDLVFELRRNIEELRLAY